MNVEGDLDIRCPQCRTKIQQREGHYLLVRNAILRVDLRTAVSYAKCPRCKTWNQVPLRYLRSAMT